jgi:ketosteroid isomerase-like protein
MNTVVSSDDLVRRYIDAYNRFDIDAMCALLTPAIRFEHYASGALGAQASGLPAFRALAETGAALFTQREQRVTALRIDGHQAFAAIAFQGTLAAAVPGGPPAGTVLTMDGSSVFTFDQGRISKIIDSA